MEDSMNEERLISLLSAQTAALGRIANALEAIALTNAPAPNFVKPIDQYGTFDFTSIGALVKGHDASGPTELEWGGYLWTRRSPQNNFGEAIWFSRATGKDAEGQVKYSRLITFKKLSEAEPLPRKVEALVETRQARNEVKTPASVSSVTPPRSELEDYLGPNPRAREYEMIWPATEIEFAAWLKQRSWNGKETRDVLGTDAKSWMKLNAGKGWADVAQTVAAVLGGGA
jgi:hypothetical protein